MKAFTALVAALSLIAHVACAQRPAPPPMPPPPPSVVFEPRGPQVILFEYGSTRFPHLGNDPATDRALQQFNTSIAPQGFLARVLDPDSGFYLVVTGHMDAAEADGFSSRLSWDRADAVSQYLIDHGFPRSRITVCSEASAPSGSSRSAIQNRRVEVLLMRDNKGCPAKNS